MCEKGRRALGIRRQEDICGVHMLLMVILDKSHSLSLWSLQIQASHACDSSQVPMARFIKIGRL